MDSESVSIVTQRTKISLSLDSTCLAVILGLYFSAMKHKCGTAASMLNSASQSCNTDTMFEDNE